MYACLFEAVCDVTTVPSHLNFIEFCRNSFHCIVLEINCPSETVAT